MAVKARNREGADTRVVGLTVQDMPVGYAQGGYDMVLQEQVRHTG